MRDPSSSPAGRLKERREKGSGIGLGQIPLLLGFDEECPSLFLHLDLVSTPWIHQPDHVVFAVGHVYKLGLRVKGSRETILREQDLDFYRPFVDSFRQLPCLQSERQSVSAVSSD